VSDRLAVFAYGSLVSGASAGRTLGRPIEDPVPARLRGHRRRWTLVRDNLRSEKTFARADDGTLPSFFLGLNLELAAAREDGPNGALIEVSEGELRRLDLRELRYDRIEVTGEVGSDGAGGFDRVFVYVAKPAHHAPDPPEGALVIATYAREVETAFASLGAGELERYRSTTDRCPVELVEAVLVRDRIPEGNPREW